MTTGRRTLKRESYILVRQISILVATVLMIGGMAWIGFARYHGNAPPQDDAMVSLQDRRSIPFGENLGRIKPSGNTRKVYPYSVIRGGVEDAAELRFAVRQDPVVGKHYWDFAIEKTHLTTAEDDRRAYVSYRIGDEVFWTKKKIKLVPGEQLLTDGVQVARTRCGNRVSDIPGRASSWNEPSEEVLNAPEELFVYSAAVTPPPKALFDLPAEAQLVTQMPIESFGLSPLWFPVDTSSTGPGPSGGIGGPGGGAPTDSPQVGSPAVEILSVGSPPAGPSPRGPMPVLPTPETSVVTMPVKAAPLEPTLVVPIFAFVIQTPARFPLSPPSALPVRTGSPVAAIPVGFVLPPAHFPPGQVPPEDFPLHPFFLPPGAGPVPPPSHPPHERPVPVTPPITPEATIPEPGSILLLSCGLGGLLLWRMKRT